MDTTKQRMFVTDDGKNVLFTFILVSSLFFLWGACNGMIDVMDKHFQDELGLTKSQSAWVQFAHYLGYFLMAMPAGWLASRLGYKGGIIAGLLMVAVGGFWFVPATKINEMAQAETVSASTAFIGYLAGVCAIAAGLTFLETVANPYTTVLGTKRYAATRINLAQSCNGVGWICGPIVGALYFYSTDEAGRSTGSETLYIPYVFVACVVLGLSVIFYFANVPDIKAEDDYHVDDEKTVADSATPDRAVSRGQVYVLLVLNAAVLIGICGMILWIILSACRIGPQLLDLALKIPHPAGFEVTAKNALLVVITAGAVVLSALAALMTIPLAIKISHRSMWSHPHFSAATLAQFLYVAGQAGIFSFLINYMTEEIPPLPTAWRIEAPRKAEGDAAPAEPWLKKQVRQLVVVKTKFVRDDIADLPAFTQRLEKAADPVSAFLSSQLSDETKAALAEYRESPAEANNLRVNLVQDLNRVVNPDVKKAEKKGQKLELLYSKERFGGIQLGEATRELAKEDPEGDDRARLNRLLLAEAYPGVLVYRDGVMGVSDKFGAFLAMFGFVCFLIGRFTGANFLKKYAAHKILALYGFLNVVACLLVFLKLGWLSAVCVFLSYFFMSIMFPTIFALGIFGLGVRAKKASAFIVMAIMGGAVLPKLMGSIADEYDMSRGFIVPLVCFAAVMLYGLCWPKLAKADSLHGVGASGGH